MSDIKHQNVLEDLLACTSQEDKDFESRLSACHDYIFKHYDITVSEHNRLCFVLGTLPLERNAPHVWVVISLIKLFLSLEDKLEVMLVVTGHNFKVDIGLNGSKEDLIFQPNWLNLKHIPDINYLLENFTPSERCRLQFSFPLQGKKENTVSGAYEYAIDRIIDFNPSHILLNAGIHYPNFFADVLFPFYPIIRYPFQVRNAISEPLDLIMSYHHYETQMDVPVQKVFLPSYLPENNQPSQYKKRNNSSILVVSAIIGMRIAKSFMNATDEFLYEFSTIFRTHKDLEWLIIGGDNKAALCDVHPIFQELWHEKRIHFMSTVPNLNAYINQADIYMQPVDEPGGGTSGLYSAHYGKPMVMFSECDLMTSLPPFSRKPSVEKGMKYFNDLIRDADYRRSEGEKNRDFIKNCYENYNKGEYHHCLQVSSTSFKKRR